MKILDLGAHDGYIGRWLAERFDADLTLDGVELHPAAAAKARERGYGTVVECRAEDAPDHLEAGSYDAVALFELVEHVPDTGRLLKAAERMVRPGGLVFVSTPDGTFGAGHNPHHLRALRSIDLADILRARGRLHNMGVGDDGVTIASYTPATRRGEIAIFCGPSWMTWSPMDIATKGLGGSETAAVRLGYALSDAGYLVTVYGQVEEGCFRDVLFRDWRTFDPILPRLAVIASRMPEIFDRPVAARARVLWLHDADCGDRLTSERADRLDRVLVLSQWHRRHVTGRYPFFPRAKVVQTRNGVHLPYFDGEPKRRRQRVLYTSSPDRGLDILLELWPKIRQRVPGAELAYGYAPVYDLVADQVPAIGAHRAEIRRLSDQAGVIPMGSLSQPELADLMRSSLVWAAPSWSTPAGAAFRETSCIGAMEAQAAGLCVVASGWGALPETVQVGQLVNGGAPGKRWRAGLVDAIAEGLTNSKLQAHAQHAGPVAAAELGWDGVADQLLGLFAAAVAA